MAYCTEAEVRASLGNISVAELPQADILDVIEEATSHIDSYISVKYALPLAIPIPPMLERICRNLSACWLHDDVIASGVMIEEDGKSSSRCERAEETLEKLRDGTTRLVYADGTVATENSDEASLPWSNTNDYIHPQFFDKDSDLDWQWNDDEIVDISSERDG